MKQALTLKKTQFILQNAYTYMYIAQLAYIFDNEVHKTWRFVVFITRRS